MRSVHILLAGLACAVMALPVAALAASVSEVTITKQPSADKTVGAPGPQHLTTGVNVAAGDLNGDGHADLQTGGAPGNGHPPPKNGVVSSYQTGGGPQGFLACATGEHIKNGKTCASGGQSH